MKEAEKEEEKQEEVSIKITGDTLRQVIAIRGKREKERGKMVSATEIIRDAVRYLYENEVS